ncbi:arabinose efflux permease [Longilinea arvoryzae]|uniref:Arabinose efflux permease n=1 Tax=Longilinea arvoryzae TaxID=360412 RepID=A0A0S7BEL4_9CHLR|nr:MFS transporter [Longilinea arvoryzae]GAP12854.1 arabinose efflux permease [Longilinea arvoryzae]
MHLPPSLRHRKFVLLWAGLFISIAGSQMQYWSLLWHIRELTDQPIAVSGIGLARFIPILAFALIGGLFADRYDRRKIMLITQATMALVALALGLLTLSGQIRLGWIYLLTAVQAVAISFDLPARQSLISNLVPRDDLASAFSMSSIAADLGAIIGPGLSGLTIAALGLFSVYMINAVSFLAVIVALLMIGTVPQQAVKRAENNHFRGRVDAGLFDIREGWRFILHQPVIMGSMILDFFATFFSSANTLLPFITRDVLHASVQQYGWLSAGQSIGAVSAALVISQRSRMRRQGSLLLGAVVIFGLATVFFGLSHSFWLTLVALILIGAGDSVSTILRNTIRQLQTPDELRGRMVSINQIFFQGGPQLGEVESGIVAQAFGPAAAIVSGGVGCVLAVGLVGGRWPQLRAYDGVEEAANA